VMEVSLGEVVQPTRPRISPSEKPNLPFIGMEHVEPHTMRIFGTISASNMKSSAVHFQSGDVLYGRLRPYLNKVCRPSFEGLCSAEFIVFPEHKNLDGRYLQYFLNSSEFVSFATHLNEGNRPRVKFEQFSHFPFPFVSYDQQKRIVEEIEKQFSRLDEAVTNLKQVKANLKRYKASVLQAAVTGKLTEAWRKQNPDVEPASKLLKRILTERRQKWEEAELAKGKDPKNDKWKEKYTEVKLPDSKIQILPSCWVLVSFGHLCKVQGGFAFKSTWYKSYGVPLVRISNLVNGLVNFKKNTAYLPPELADKYPEYLLKEGDTLMALSGATTEKMAVFESEKVALLNQRVGRFNSTTGKHLNSKYLPFVVKVIGSTVLKEAYGAAQPNASPKQIEAMGVPLPPKNEQKIIIQEIESRLSVAEEIERTVDPNLKRAERLRQSILKQAFSGKLV